MHKPEIINIFTQELKQNQEILFAYVFGSFVNGENYKDVDVARYVNNLSNQINKSLQELSKYQDIPNVEILKSSEKLGNIKYAFGNK